MDHMTTGDGASNDRGHGPSSAKGLVNKSFQSQDPVIRYCARLSVTETDIEKELRQKTLEGSEMAGAMGAPEVLQLGKMFLRLLHAKKVLDIGTFTGLSAVAWATVLPDDGNVISTDVKHEALDAIGRPVISKLPAIMKKIDFRLAPALEVLDELISSGGAGTWDMAFIDADKNNNWNYYVRCKKLLRRGGVILVDNALVNGKAAVEPNPSEDEWKRERIEWIREANEKIFNDPDTDSILLNLGDGTHVAFTK
ncbi:O-methyltransferase family protein [Aphelenchoides avenae]|nr:O-methyltransferase family protein [Aphelenchus avenae]KAH7702584.1 O-methyltransferase family protein [Aphelenchus avenae]